MAVFRRWILPIAWLMVFGVIAVAMVKIAFFPDDDPAGADSEASPTGELSEPQVAVERGTIRNDLELEASIVSDPAEDVEVSKPGTVIDVFVSEGDEVDAGAVLASVREDVENADGEVYAVWSEIVAPTAGILASLDVSDGQTVTAADVVGAVAPSSFRVQGAIAAADRYRLVDEPTNAEIAITNGPEPFECSELVLETPLAGSDDERSGDGEVVTTVRCPVPGEVRVFPGLAATMTIAGGLAEDALTVPMTAVLGTADAGTVFVPGDDGLPEEREVELGINDGTRIEVVSGLDEGEMVFEYVPGSALAVPQEECVDLPDGGTDCYLVSSDATGQG